MQCFFFRKSFPLVAGQVVFFALFFWYFLQYNFLRPCVDIWIEIIIALLLIATMTANFWLLYPLVFKKRSFLAYMFLSLFESVIINIIECLLTYPTFQSVYKEVFQAMGKTTMVLLPTYSNTLLRDFALLIFAGLVADNIRLSKKQVENDQELLRSKNQLIARNGNKSCVIDMKTIFLCRQEKNYATLYAVNGQQYKKRISLKDLEELLRALHFIRISKSDIVCLSYIKKNENNLLILTDDIRTGIKVVTVNKSYMESAIPAVLKFLHNASESISDTSTEKEGQVIDSKQDAKIIHHPRAFEIQQYISTHPDCKLNEIVTATNIPKATMTRYLKVLQEQNLVKYIGSKKTGGYRVVEIEE